jgi:NADH-quinone oxidoreductase subunit L
MFRLYFSIFWNHSRNYEHTPHESPATMTFPLIFLAVASVVAGFVPFHDLVTSDGRILHTDFHWMIAVPSVLVALVGMGLAAILYYKQNTKPENLAFRLKGIYKVTSQKFFIDEIYLFITQNIIFQFVSRPVAWFDRHVVDGSMNFVGNTTVFFSGAIKRIQSGHIQLYIWLFASGALLLTLAVLYLTK